MKVDYLFVIPLTPESAGNQIRKELRDCCFEQITKLKASKKVWLLGPYHTNLPDFEVIETKGESKEDKLFEVGFLVNRTPEMARYLVRLDDDDMINPELFDKLAALDVDCMADRMHWFYDLSSARCSAQERPWIPNTAIQKMEHALTKVKSLGGSALAGDQNFLFALDHSKAWHKYYTGKAIHYTSPEEPLYLRILSPRSRTAGGSDDFENTFPIYLSRFGTWKSPFPFEKETLLPKLKAIWTNNEGELRNWVFPQKTFVSRFLNRINPGK